jgi:hypothetical protein
MHILVVFDRREMRPEVVLAGRWCQRQISDSPIDSRHRFSIGGLMMFLVCRVPFKSHSTFSAVL